MQFCVQLARAHFVIASSGSYFWPPGSSRSHLPTSTSSNGWMIAPPRVRGPVGARAPSTLKVAANCGSSLDALGTVGSCKTRDEPTAAHLDTNCPSSGNPSNPNHDGGTSLRGRLGSLMGCRRIRPCRSIDAISYSFASYWVGGPGGWRCGSVARRTSFPDRDLVSARARRPGIARATATGLSVCPSLRSAGEGEVCNQESAAAGLVESELDRADVGEVHSREGAERHANRVEEDLGHRHLGSRRIVECS